MDLTENLAAHRPAGTDITATRPLPETLRMQLTNISTVKKPLCTTTDTRLSMSLSYVLPESTSVMESTPIKNGEHSEPPSAIQNETNAFEPLYELMLNSICEISQSEPAIPATSKPEGRSIKQEYDVSAANMSLGPTMSVPMRARVRNQFSNFELDSAEGLTHEAQNNTSMDITMNQVPVTNISRKKESRLTINQPCEISPDVSLLVHHPSEPKPKLSTQSKPNDQKSKSMNKDQNETIYDQLSIEQSSDFAMDMTLNNRKSTVPMEMTPSYRRSCVAMEMTLINQKSSSSRIGTSLKCDNTADSMIIDKPLAIPEEDKENIIIIPNKDMMLAEHPFASKSNHKPRPPDVIDQTSTSDKENVIFVENDNSMLIEQQFQAESKIRRLTSHIPVPVDVSIVDRSVGNITIPTNELRKSSISTMDISHNVHKQSLDYVHTNGTSRSKQRDIVLTSSKGQNMFVNKRRTCVETIPIEESVIVLDDTQKNATQQDHSIDEMSMSNYEIPNKLPMKRPKETIYFNENVMEVTSAFAKSRSNSPADMINSANQTLSGTACENFNQLIQMTLVSDELEKDILMDTKLDLVESSIDSVCPDEVPLKVNQQTLHLRVPSPVCTDRKSFTLPVLHENSALENIRRISIQENVSINMPRTSDAPRDGITEEVDAHNPGLKSTKENASHRRSSFTFQNSTLGEMSYLHNVTRDVSMRQIKLDLSKYDRLRGIATPIDVFDSFKRRYELQNQQMLEISNVSTFNLTINNPDSQNVEAPDFNFLYRNKIEVEQ